MPNISPQRKRKSITSNTKCVAPQHGDWGPEHKGALKSLVAGRQWTQQRLHSAGLVDSDLCQLCLELPGGRATGTLMHRLCCPALACFREAHMPQWIRQHLDQNVGSLSSGVFLAVTRGLFHAPVLPDRDASKCDTF